MGFDLELRPGAEVFTDDIDLLDVLDKYCTRFYYT